MTDQSQSTEGRADVSGAYRSITNRFDVLSHARRRAVLAVLADRTTPIAVEALADAVAEHEAADATRVSASEREAVHVTLHHVHLPKLDEAGAVDYQREARTVTPRHVPSGVPIELE